MNSTVYLRKGNNMKIGNVTLENGVFLAPMAGVTDLPFRVICKKFGAGLVYSEMVSAKALNFNDKKTIELLKTNEDEAPLAVQIFGHEPDIMAQNAYKALSTGAKILDINMGCPAPKVANNGDGSSLLKTPDLMGEIVYRIKKEVDVPVTCKIRSGFDSVADVENIAKILEQSGIDAICVHPRTRAMYYSGNADWDIIKRVKDSVSVPVIGNGDIRNAEDALRMINKTNCDAIMIARGARGNPFIFTEILEYLNNGKIVTEFTLKDKMNVLKEHINMLVDLKGEYIGVRESRKHIAWYIKSFKSSAAMRQKVCSIGSLDILLDELDKYTMTLVDDDEN